MGKSKVKEGKFLWRTSPPPQKAEDGSSKPIRKGKETKRALVVGYNGSQDDVYESLPALKKGITKGFRNFMNRVEPEVIRKEIINDEKSADYRDYWPGRILPG